MSRLCGRAEVTYQELARCSSLSVDIQCGVTGEVLNGVARKLILSSVACGLLYSPSP